MKRRKKESNKSNIARILSKAIYFEESQVEFG